MEQQQHSCSYRYGGPIYYYDSNRRCRRHRHHFLHHRLYGFYCCVYRIGCASGHYRHNHFLRNVFHYAERRYTGWDMVCELAIFCYFCWRGYGILRRHGHSILFIVARLRSYCCGNRYIAMG
jgi:hypothetical protein